ncbi:ankyrin repeat domain-containing protein [Actinacidiphila alni]|uniref:ankyrin repeat domain-containing protein n=1 Tax=Actinacidiphila alni TaxID=380248 RepID=UPI0033F04C89
MTERGAGAGNRMGRVAMHDAAAIGDLAGVRAALSAGADPNVADTAGWTALHFAAQAQSAVVTAELLAGGAVVDSVDRQGNTPLWRAVFNYRGDPGVLLVLREGGADPDLVNAHGVSPRQLAGRIANYDVAAHVTW